MKKIRKEVLIKAKPATVWAVLTDFESFPQWNPFIHAISGDKEMGAQLAVTIKPPDGKALTFKPRVLAFRENEELRWKGKLLFRGLFDGEHYFRLTEKEDGSTSFIQGENFSGCLVGLLGKVIEKTGQGFEEMNAALKRKCESINSSQN